MPQLLNVTNILESNPLNIFALFILGSLSIDRCDYDNAIIRFSNIIAINEDDPGAFNNRGYAYYMKKDYNKALIDFKKAINIDPDFADAYQNLGNVYFYTNKLESAIEMYTKAINIIPDNGKYFYSRANAYRDLTKYDHALDDYNRSIQLDDTFHHSFCNRGDLYRRLGKDHLAEQDFVLASQLDKKDEKLIYNLGLIYFDRKDYERAIELFTKYIKMDPEEGQAYFIRATCKIKQLEKNPLKLEEADDSTIANAIIDLTNDLEMAAKLGQAVAQEMLNEAKKMF